MKALTHEEWMKDPTPRVMWVWDDDEDKEKMKVVYISNQDIRYPVVTADNNEEVLYRYKHCAEIEKTRRMTNKELARWLRLNPTRECKQLDNSNDSFVYSIHTYLESNANKEVNPELVIRENDGEWREPLIEVEE